MIEFENVSFNYGEKPILRNVSFTVDSGESVVVMGPSGSGKSTVLRLILGLSCPQEGRILVDGKNICAMREKDKQDIRKQIGMVFQDGALFDSLTVGENVAYYLIEHTRMDWDDIESKAREMLGFDGLEAEEVIEKLPDQLSGGMQRRVAIGRALLSTNPKVMLYDEPTTGLDPQMTANILQLIQRLHRENQVSTIMVTHQIADALQIADRFVVIVAGEKVFDGNVNALRDSADPRVRGFLSPFRDSVSEVANRKFV